MVQIDSNTTVLVTGGCGLIGSHIVDLLIERFNCKVKVLDCLDKDTHPSQQIPPWQNPKATYQIGNVANREDLEKALEGVDLVFHQAAAGGVVNPYYRYLNENAAGTALFYDIIKEKKLSVKKIVVASSQGVYGEGVYENSDKSSFKLKEYRKLERLQRGEWEVEDQKLPGQNAIPIPTTEDNTLDATSAYSLSKLAQEKGAINFGREIGVPSVALRYGVTFGPRQSISNPYTGVISIFSTRIRNGMAPVIYEDGMQTRDYIFVKDVAEANLCVMLSDDANYQVFNVANCQPCPMIKVAKRLCELWDRPDLEPVLTGQFRHFDVRHLILDNTKLKKLGWTPKYNVWEAMQEQVNWIKSVEQDPEFFKRASALSGVVQQAASNTK